MSFQPSSQLKQLIQKADELWEKVLQERESASGVYISLPEESPSYPEYKALVDKIEAISQKESKGKYTIQGNSIRVRGSEGYQRFERKTLIGF